MYQLNATRILYQTSKYAPVAVLLLDITVPAEIGSRAQISESLERIGRDGFESLLPQSGETSAVSIYCDLYWVCSKVLDIQCNIAAWMRQKLRLSSGYLSNMKKRL